MPALASSRLPLPPSAHTHHAPPRPLPGRPPNAPAACSLGDRPVLCCDVHWATGQAAVGSSDHAVYTLDLQAGACAKRRTLYTKTHGHSE